MAAPSSTRRRSWRSGCARAEGGLTKAIQTNPRLSLLYRDSKSRSTVVIQGRGHIATDEETRRRVYEMTPEVEQFHDTQRNGAALIIDVTRLQGGGPKGNFRMQREAPKRLQRKLSWLARGPGSQDSGPLCILTRRATGSFNAPLAMQVHLIPQHEAVAVRVVQLRAVAPVLFRGRRHERRAFSYKLRVLASTSSTCSVNAGRDSPSAPVAG